MFDLFDLIVLFWSSVHNLNDPFVIIAASALGGGTLAAMRRIDADEMGDNWRNATKRVVVGAVVTATTSGAAAAVGLELAPNYPKLVLGLIVFVSGIVDTTTDDGRAWIQREIFGRLLAMFDAARGGKYNPPSPPPPTPVPPAPSPSPAPWSKPASPPATSTPTPEAPRVESMTNQASTPNAAPNPKKGPW